MRRFVLILLSVFLSGMLYAQMDLIPYRKGNQWGFSDRNKKTIIPCQYNDTEPFKYGLAKVKIKQKYGLINPTGKLVLIAEYDNIAIHSEFVIVRKNGLKGVFDMNGKEILPVKYQEIETDEQSNIFATKRYENTKIFDKKGIPIIEKKSQKHTLLIVLDSKTNKYGLNKLNKPITPYKYDEIGELSEGFLAFKVQNKWGFLDTTGKEVIPFKYDFVSPFETSLAKVCVKGKCGVINKQGKQIMPFQYQNIKIINPQTFAIQTDDGKWSIIDEKKKTIQAPKYDDVNVVDNGYLEVFIEKDISFLKKYDYAGRFNNGIAIITLKMKKGFVTEEGKEITPLMYEDVQDFQEGRAWVMQNGKWGLIDTKGNLIISCKYQEVMSFSEGLASVKMNNKWGYVDVNGTEVIKCQYDLAGAFTNGITFVISNGKASIINKEGKTQLDISDDESFETEAILEFPDEPIHFTPKKLRKKLGYVDSKGTEYWED